MGSILVVGGGIAGIQASLDLANSGFRVYLIEKLSVIGGRMAQLDKTFPTNDCSMCILSPKLNEVERHENIEVINNAEILSVEGKAGKFKVKFKRYPTYINDKCTGCGLCASFCPTSAIDEYNECLSYRSAVYLRYPQAVPRVFVIDKSKCIGCGICKNVCPSDAIDFSQKEVEGEVEVGAIILAPGAKLFSVEKRGEYGFGKLKNVVTSIQFERLLSSTGPFDGHLVRPSDGKVPKKIAIVQCVGSRDQKTNPWCSSVCCTYATKHAIIAKELIPDAEIHIYSIDLRTFGKGFEEYANRAKDLGVLYKYGRVANVFEKGSKVVIKYEENGRSREEEYDLVVLSIGFEPSEDFLKLSKILGVNLNEFGFFESDSFVPVKTNVEGIYVAGVAVEPKDISESVAQGSAAAALASAVIASERGKMVELKEYQKERDVAGEPPRIGVFVCHCGINIAAVVDVLKVAEFAKTLEGVVYSENILFACSADAQEKIKKVIKDFNLNRVVVAACTPRTHEQLFRNTLREVGLNPYLFEFVNIREQCSWVHKDSKKATEKAIELVKAGVAKARLLEPLSYIEVPIEKRALIIGGGLAGMICALGLAKQGIECYLVEKERELGGHLRHVYYTIDGKNTQELLKKLVDEVEKNPMIKVFKNAFVKSFEGFIGNYTATIVCGSREEKVRHGVTILATGADVYRPKEYFYGEDERILTQTQLEEKIFKGEVPKSVVMVQCVGSRNDERPYCSRICCQAAVKNALKMKEIDPNVEVFILFRDVRTYGFLEKYYAKALERGVIFLRYKPEKPPIVKKENGKISVEYYDEILEGTVAIEPEYLVLSVAVVAREESKELSEILKVPITEHGFFLEAHPKLRPVDFASEGIFLCGLAHSPKLIPETISQALAVVSRAMTLLTKDKLIMEATKADVNKDKCDACGICVKACPVKAIEIKNFETGAGVIRKAEVNKALCLGCGICGATCPKVAVTVKGFTFDQVVSEIKALSS